MAWTAGEIACVVLLVWVAVVVPCVCVLCCKCNPHWKYSPCGHWPRWRRVQVVHEVDVVDFGGPGHAPHVLRQ